MVVLNVTELSNKTFRVSISEDTRMILKNEMKIAIILLKLQKKKVDLKIGHFSMWKYGEILLHQLQPFLVSLSVVFFLAI